MNTKNEKLSTYKNTTYLTDNYIEEIFENTCKNIDIEIELGNATSSNVWAIRITSKILLYINNNILNPYFKAWYLLNKDFEILEYKLNEVYKDNNEVSISSIMHILRYCLCNRKIINHTGNKLLFYHDDTNTCKMYPAEDKYTIRTVSYAEKDNARSKNELFNEDIVFSNCKIFDDRYYLENIESLYNSKTIDDIHIISEDQYRRILEYNKLYSSLFNQFEGIVVYVAKTNPNNDIVKCLYKKYIGE